MKGITRNCLARAVAMLPPGILFDTKHAEIFQARGYHIVQDNFYNAIPNINDLDRSLWDHPSDLPGITLKFESLVALLDEFASAGYIDEYFNILYNERGGHVSGIGRIDGAILYGMIRKCRPERIIEVGAGQSTLWCLSAIRTNGSGSLISIDPYPADYLRALKFQYFELIEDRVERQSLDLFSTLKENDIFFIDSSHVIRLGGDVLFEVLDVVPRLAVGCLIHFHDIFLPHHYPMDWVIERRTFWTEQYLVQAFLAFNSAFEIIWGTSMMETYRRAELEKHLHPCGDSSLWI
ncbi:MAG TPA: class I SAM-dependent methyltransferase, partial [Xanthobacteraceae bacterium]